IVLAGSFLIDAFVCAEAMDDMCVCYILDGILVLYGVILTILYCRLRVSRILGENLFGKIRDQEHTFHLERQLAWISNSVTVC
uniref:Uncharacterized protein n=1 Tax=Takifugu rubripes TaxID=31033 RepID=A0A3B5KDU1_TAKRU